MHSQVKATGGGASLNGTVTDQTQAVITNAKVAVINGSGGGGAIREAQTDDKGAYSISGLAAGTYTLIVTAPNFASQKFDNIALADGQQLTLDATLQPESAKGEEVNVIGGGPAQIEADTNAISGTISRREVVTIGLNGRVFSQLIKLAPGVSDQTGQDEAKVGVLGSVKYSVNGGRVEYNTFEVDSSDVLNTGLNGASSTLMVYPSLDAIQEMKVLTSNYGAQYGRTASGTVQVVTKSGGSKLHGNLYDFTRNEAFNDKNYFDLTAGAPLYRRQDFGGTIGGPLTIPHVFNTKKDKTFFFFSEEVRLEKTPVEYNQAVPSLKERGLIMTAQGVKPNLITTSTGVDQHTVVSQDFDFDDVCPPEGSLPQNTGFSRQQFPDCPAISRVVGAPASSALSPVYHLNLPSTGNPISIGSAGVDKNALAILNANLIPLPNSPFGCNFRIANPDPTDPNHCYVASVSPSTYWREELFRVDQNLGSNLRATFRYIHDSWDTTVLAPQWSFLRTSNPSAGTFPTIQNRFFGPGISLVGKLTHTISPTTLNVITLDYVNSTITLADHNGPGGAVFARNSSLDQALVVDPANPGQCNPSLSVDPILDGNVPQCAMGHIFNNGFGGKMPGIEILGTNAAYGGRGFAADPAYMPWSHTSPTYSIRDDVFKSTGKHTLTFGGQAVYAQRNQTNNAIGGASGELQGFLTFSNLVRSTGNAFADFLLLDAFCGITNNSSSCVSPATGKVQSYIQSFTQDSAQSRYYQRFEVGEPYFQDDWKVTSRLTLNLGIRVSLFGTYSEKNKNAWNWVASNFNKSRFAVDPCSGVLLDKLGTTASSTATCTFPGNSPIPVYGSPVQFNPSTFQLDPGIVKDLGLVQCGTGTVPSGCMTSHWFNPAPRVGFAYDPKGDGKTSIRGGYGIFYEHGTGNEANTGSLEASAPVVLSMTQPNPLNYPCIGNVGYGAVFDPTNSACAATGSTAPPAGSVFPLNVTAIPTKAVWPYAQQWSFGVQRELGAFVTSISYVGSRGTHLTLERNANQLPDLPLSQNPFALNEPLTVADCTSLPLGVTLPSSGAPPVPGGGTIPFVLQNGSVVAPQSPAYVHLQAACTSPNTPNVNSLAGRPYPGLGQVLSLENVANSSYNALQMTLRRVRGPLTTAISYSYSHSLDNSSDRSDPVLPDAYNLRSNRASSNFDQRHLLIVNYVWSLPRLTSLGRYLFPTLQDDERGSDSKRADLPAGGSHLAHALLDGWEVEGLATLQSGTPFTVINTSGNTGVSLTDNAGVASYFGIAQSYPDVIKAQNRPLDNVFSFGPLLGNPSQFVAPRGLTFGDAGRNFLNNPFRFNMDMTLLKHFKFTESSELEFHADAFNFFNNTQFRIYDPDNPSATGNNVASCYGGPQFSAGFQGAGGADCVTGASFLHPINAHRPRTVQFGLKLSF